ncbi:phosphotransferase [Nocardia sp. NPDC049220]|uniref:phosphotransferase enzyme family protein n=1 Tax=Nocardia sp. NPDC049220 TaxID=3155273 RepID=UPI0033C20322
MSTRTANAAAVPAELIAACQSLGLNTSGATSLRQHATGVYLLPAAEAVARVGRAETADQTATSLAVVQWLAEQGFPVPEPLTCEPVPVARGSVVTVWRYYPQNAPGQVTVSDLGALLRQLHQLDNSPVPLPAYQPLAELRSLLGSEAAAGLLTADREWLTRRAGEVVEAYHQLDSALGVGLVHGDAYPGNLMIGAGGVVMLGDWDEIARAPRELDLVNTYQGRRFGRTPAQLDAFSCAYGWDVRNWSGFSVLREMRDLHTLASFIRRAATGHHSAAAAEFSHRIATLRTGDTTARWHAA